METTTEQGRGQWGSRLGFILAASGSAVGLGNIWRFPYMTGENGGAAFVFVYLICVFFIGLPLLYNELAIGRASGRNPIDAFLALRPGTKFALNGLFCLVLCFVVLSYYSVIAGWAIGYVYNTALGAGFDFETFIAARWAVIPLFGLFLLVTVLIVMGGVEKGIERWVKFLMPMLLVLVLVIIVRSVTLEGAGEGIKYYLNPDWKQVRDPNVWLMALGQAFFSLSVGWGLMITYGSYMKKSQGVVANGFWVVIADTGVALLGGLMVFPAVFAFDLNPAAGATLTFETLPQVFEQMPAGIFIGTLFFILLTIAALTSSISMLEVPVSYFVDSKRATRRMAACVVGGLAFCLGLPSVLSQGSVDSLTKIPWFDAKGVAVEFGYPGATKPEARYHVADKVTAAIEASDAADDVAEDDEPQAVKGVSSVSWEFSEGKVVVTAELGGSASVADTVEELETRVGAITFPAAVGEPAFKPTVVPKTISFLDLLDATFGTLGVVVIALLCSLFTGWFWQTSKAAAEIREGSPGFSGQAEKVWSVFIKFICPVVITIVLARTFLGIIGVVG